MESRYWSRISTEAAHAAMPTSVAQGSTPDGNAPEDKVATIVVMHGDKTGEQLLAESLRLLEPAVIGINVKTEDYDLSLTTRQATNNDIVRDAAQAVKRHRFGLKAATDTVENLPSPNAILREGIDASVIVRSARPLPGIPTVAGITHPITVVRMAVGGAYGAEEHRELERRADRQLSDVEEVAYRRERITRRSCQQVAEFSFREAARTEATVFGGPKWTVSPVYEGMLKEEMDAAAKRHRSVPYEPWLIDATFALILKAAAQKPLVVPTLNRDGDILSDLVLPLFGSIAGAESVITALDDQFAVRAVIAEAAHGTAPLLENKNTANPLAMILSVAFLLEQNDGDETRTVGRAIRSAAFDTVAADVRTTDLGGQATTSDFTDAVITRVQRALFS
jgi:isocitrate/isopropylmalate dehydrogenase